MQNSIAKEMNNFANRYIDSKLTNDTIFSLDDDETQL